MVLSDTVAMDTSLVPSRAKRCFEPSADASQVCSTQTQAQQPAQATGSRAGQNAAVSPGAEPSSESPDASQTCSAPSVVQKPDQAIASQSGQSLTSSLGAEPSTGSPDASQAHSSLDQSSTGAIQANSTKDQSAQRPAKILEADEPRQSEQPAYVGQLSEPNTEILEAQELAKQSSSKKEKKPLRKMVPSSYDPEALIMRKPGFERQPCYKIGAAVEYNHRAILAINAYPSTLGEGQSMGALFTDMVRKCGHDIKKAVADSGMDDASFHATVEFFGATPITGLQKNTSIASGFGKEKFYYDKDKDVYICPAGQELHRKSGIDDLRPAYVAPKQACDACPLKLLCFGSIKGPKTLNRTHDEESRDRVVAAYQDPLHKKLRRQRKVKVEPVFADVKEQGGMAEIYTKGLAKAQAKAKFAAVGWNLKLLVSHKQYPGRFKPGPKRPQPIPATGTNRPQGINFKPILILWAYLSILFGVHGFSCKPQTP